MAYTPAMRKGVLYEYMRCGNGAKGRVAEQLCNRTTNYQNVLAAVLTGLGQTTWESFFSDSDSEAELLRELSRLKDLEEGLQVMKIQRQNLVARVQDAAAAGADLALLQTLQDGASLKDADIAKRELLIGHTTARIAELRHHPLASAWPALRDQIRDMMQVFGRGNDSEVDRAQLNGLLVSHGIEVFLDLSSSAVAFVVNGRSQFHFFDPDQSVIQLWHGIVQNAFMPSELVFQRELVQEVKALRLDVGPVPGVESTQAERDAWREAAEVALHAAEEGQARLRDHIEEVGMLYEGDLEARASQIRREVCAQRLRRRSVGG